MAQRFEVRDGATIVGEFSGDQIRQLAADGTLNVAMQIRRLPVGPWASLSSVKGLQFKSPTNVPVAAMSPPANPSPVQVVPTQPAPNDFDALAVNLLSQATPVAAAGPAEIECPYCSELIKATAKKCKHCGEFLDRTVEQAASTVSSLATKVRDDLDGIATNQGRLVICGIVFTGFQLLAMAFPILFLVSWIFWYAGAVFSFFLAMKVYDAGMGTVMGLLGLVPYIGAVGFFLVSAQAKFVLRQHGQCSQSSAGTKSPPKAPSKAAAIFLAAIISPVVFLAAAVILETVAGTGPLTYVISALIGVGFFCMMLLVALLSKRK